MSTDSKKINIKINEKIIELSIKHNLIATKSYVDAYERTKDYKESFYNMILESLEDDNNLAINDIKTINEDNLIEIGKIILNQSKDLLLNYKNDKTKTFYENFHYSVIKEYEKYKTNIQEISNGFSDVIKTFKKGIDYLSNSIVNQSDIANNKNIIDNFSNENFNPSLLVNNIKPFKNPVHGLLKEQIQENKNITKILLETEQKNTIANEESTKMNEKNLRFVKYTLIVTIIGVIISIISICVTIKLNNH